MASIGSSLIPIVETGTNLLLKAIDTTLPNNDKLLLTDTIPSSKIWKLRRIETQCRAYGYFYLKINSNTIAKVNSGPASENYAFEWSPFYSANDGDVIEIWYNQGAGPTVDVSFFLSITEI